MTNIEVKACEAIMGINRTLKEKKIDWEQRRYEVARELFLAYSQTKAFCEAQRATEQAIEDANKFITALKERMGI